MSMGGLLKKIKSLRGGMNAELLEVVEEEIPEIDPLPVNSTSCVSSEWLKQKNLLTTPLVLLDSDLLIRWRNDAFKTFRETEGLEYEGRHFYELFTTFAERKSLEQLISTLTTPKSGYGWNGRVTARAPGRGHKNILLIAELSIMPLEYDEGSKPEWYIAVITDVTETEKAIIRANFDSILRASLLKDKDTGTHIKRVNAYSQAIAKRLTGQWKWVDVDGDLIDNIFIEDIGIFAAFHDVGKIGTPEVILLKNGKLNEAEWDVMREHPINGALILDAHPSPMVKNIASSHHERWNGSGYPFGLSGEDIPLSARIVAIADVYDALRTRRPYKKPFSEKKTTEIIISDTGTHFDPNLIDVFKELRTEFNLIFAKMPDN